MEEWKPIPVEVVVGTAVVAALIVTFVYSFDWRFI
jgi:hypothetical protein